MGSDEISHGFREQLERDLNHFSSMMTVQSLQKYGWLTITFKDVAAVRLASGERCDVASPCDSFIRILVNGEQVFRTQTFWDTAYHNYRLTYQTEKMHKKLPVTIELWDYDTVSSNDMILSWNTNVKELLKKRVKYGVEGNAINFEASWREQKITT